MQSHPVKYSLAYSQDTCSKLNGKWNETLIWGRIVAVTTWKSIPQAPNNAQGAAALDYLVLFQKVQLVDEGKQQFLDLHEVKVIAKMPYGSLLGTI